MLSPVASLILCKRWIYQCVGKMFKNVYLKVSGTPKLEGLPDINAGHLVIKSFQTNLLQQSRVVLQLKAKRRRLTVP